MKAELVTDGKTLTSRLWVGTGKGVEYGLMRDCIAATQAEIVTVAIRRIPTDEKAGETLLDSLKGKTLLPNTALCYTARDAALAMELGADAVLMQTAIYGAKNPVKMAHAMRHAIEAGRLAYEAGRTPKKLYATASSPVEGVVGS